MSRPGEGQAEKSSVHYIGDGDQTERWRKEFVQKKEYEISLAAVSKLYYEEVDYEPLLEIAEFPPLVLNNYDHLYGQALRTVETEFFIPISIRTALLFGLAIVLIVFFNVIILGITTILSGVLAASLYHTKKEKKLALEKSHEMVAAEILKRHDEETRAYNEAKENFEQSELERIESIQSLLDGNQNSIGGRLVDAFKTMQLPVMVEVDIEYFNNVPLAKIWLPSKAVIPQQQCELLPSGKIQYKDKELRVFNKQYFELTAGVVTQVALIILGNIPSFEYCYAWGMVKGDESDTCLMAVKVTRETAADAGRVGAAITALQFLDCTYNADTNFILKPLVVEKPKEWGNIESKKVYNIQVKIFK